ncbi:GNAT family N-acetyltransferase [Devosia lacusdianchii]|uniref:GNAT family N-acetyltransferase n=1 Tax=Devosia lacusdianchii TaxID=2917991 RepID=UPI001F06C4C6|nr:GNAT family N-acetyltransferase [Devosia sp. JXJ CY 41]
MSITYQREQDLPVADYIAVVGETTLGANRPIANPERVRAMIDGSNFIVTARDDSGQAVGLARCMSDGAWICYCMDLAVRDSQQGKGIGRGLIAKCREILGPKLGFILVSEPAAESFYAGLGMEQYKAFFHPRTDSA